MAEDLTLTIEFSSEGSRTFIEGQEPKPAFRKRFGEKVEGKPVWPKDVKNATS